MALSAMILNGGVAAVAALLLASLIAAAGFGLLRWLPLRDSGAAGGRWLLAIGLGLLWLWGVALAVAALGLPWNALTLLLPLGAMAVAGALRAVLEKASSPNAVENGGVSSLSPATAPARGSYLLAEQLAVLLAVVAHGIAASRMWATNPDFVYHWGVKARRFLWEGGLDLGYLGAGSFAPPHGDYPPLLPILQVASGCVHRLLGGAVLDPLPSLLLSPLLLALLALAVHEALAAAETPPLVRAGTTAATVLLLAGFATQHRLAGGPDLLVAVGLVAGVAGVVRVSGAARRTGADQRGGIALTAVAASIAVVSKAEGVGVAAVLALLAAFCSGGEWMRPGSGWRPGVAAGFRAGALVAGVPLLALAPWLLFARRHQLFGSAVNAGGPIRFENVPELATAGLAALLHPHWHGAAAGLLVAAVAALAVRRARPAALAALGYTVVLLVAYLTARHEVADWVASSLPRLLAQVVPTAAVAAGIALGGWLAPGLAVVPSEAPSPRRLSGEACLEEVESCRGDGFGPDS